MFARPLRSRSTGCFPGVCNALPQARGKTQGFAERRRAICGAVSRASPLGRSLAGWRTQGVAGAEGMVVAKFLAPEIESDPISGWAKNGDSPASSGSHVTQCCWCMEVAKFTDIGMHTQYGLMTSSKPVIVRVTYSVVAVYWASKSW